MCELPSHDLTLSRVTKPVSQTAQPDGFGLEVLLWAAVIGSSLRGPPSPAGRRADSWSLAPSQGLTAALANRPPWTWATALRKRLKKTSLCSFPQTRDAQTTQWPFKRLSMLRSLKKDMVPLVKPRRTSLGFFPWEQQRNQLVTEVTCYLGPFTCAVLTSGLAGALDTSAVCFTGTGDGAPGRTG